MEVAGDITNVSLDEHQIGYELRLLAKAIEQLKARQDAMEGLAVARIQGGKPIPGYEQRRALSNRQWSHASIDETLAFGQLAGVDLATERKACSPAQAEARGVPRNMIDLFTERTQGAAKLVRVDPNKATEVFNNGRK
jgi:hypothetical protein